MSTVVIGIDPHKRSATVEVMAVDETVLGGAVSPHPDTYAAPGPEPGTYENLDTRRRSSRGSGGSE